MLCPLCPGGKGGHEMPASPPTSCSDRAFSPMDHVTIHFGFKMFFFTVSVLCIWSLATLSIVLLFKQISLSQRKSGERYTIILSFFFWGEEKGMLRSLSFQVYCTNHLNLCLLFCFLYCFKLPLGSLAFSDSTLPNSYKGLKLFVLFFVTLFLALSKALVAESTWSLC